MKKFLTLIVALFPSFLARPLLSALGHKIGRKVKIGFSLIYANSLRVGDRVIIGHGNLIFNDKLELLEKSKIGYLNIFKGSFTLKLHETAAIGNKNYFTRGKQGITYDTSALTLGELTKITTGHHIDLTRSISFGKYSILAGVRSQMWTHGYYHDNEGKDRIRIDGSIDVGDNVYVGSGCIFNPGVKIANAIHIGGGSVVSKNLSESGMYVNQGLRFIKTDINDLKTKLKKVEGYDLVEPVYIKE